MAKKIKRGGEIRQGNGARATNWTQEIKLIYKMAQNPVVTI